MKLVGTLLLAVIIMMAVGTSALADSLDDELVKAKNLYDAGKLAEAREVIIALKKTVDEKLKATPDDAHLNYLAGLLGSDSKESATALDKAIKAEPKNATYLTARAALYLSNYQAPKAMATAKRAEEADPKAIEAWDVLAKAQMELKDWEGAKTSVGKMIQLNPKNAKHLEMMGNVLKSQGKESEALDQYKKAVAVDPAFWVGYLDIGRMEEKAKRYPEALAAFESALKLQPDNLYCAEQIVELNAAFGKIKERDAAREYIMKLWKAGKIIEPTYCLEQIPMGQTIVIANEYFAPKGDEGPYSFLVFSADEKKIEPSITLYFEATKRTFVLRVDENMNASDPVIHVFNKEPSYDEAREIVMQYLNEKLKAMSPQKTAQKGE